MRNKRTDWDFPCSRAFFVGRDWHRPLPEDGRWAKFAGPVTPEERRLLLSDSTST